MGEILNIRNMNSFIGRYKGRKKSVEKYIGWLAEDGLYEKFPILSLRNRNEYDDEWPLTWARNRNLPIAISLVGNSLKAWRAYRPITPKKVITKMHKTLPGIIIRLQNQFLKYSVYSADDFRKGGKERSR